ncbi:hypothetical protein C1H46_033405 [Malus baccata]|uniref:Terpene synthase N-terminal domain-containing protein n=1 Tax=Malus baccata TaxID=106549 RepID=A0A540L478_MALBA|nr:hypothetical protein C1H46_033405 [Malus baccata]
MSSVEVPLSQSSSPNDTFDPKPSATFSPSIWGDHFLSYASLEVDAELEQHVQELKEEVRSMLMTSPENVSQKLNLIDDIQRLGVSYHFGNEIEEILQKIHKSSYDLDDLYTVALRFRLLRQQGYNVSCDLFNKLKDGDGKFKESLVDDVVGLLSLYEATHLRIHGEEILDEALTFTTTNLESATFRLSPPLAKAVTHALNQPLRKGLPRVEARYYLSVYEELRESPNETLLTFAKLDFNRLQRVHQKELSEITRWWKDLDVPNKLPFARDRLVEMKNQVRGFFDEAKLFRQNHMPSLDEYMSVSLMTCGYPLLITTSFVGMEEATIDSFDWLLTSPQAVKAASTVTRLMDDIADHKLEQEREHFASAVNCYMRKYGATEEEAIIELRRQVNNAWKDINEACLHPTAVAMPLLIRILNFARVMDVVYKCEDGYNNADDCSKLSQRSGDICYVASDYANYEALEKWCGNWLFVIDEKERWWKDLDVPNKLPFARDRLVEVYFCWSLSIYFQPQYSFARRTSCKVTAIISIIDDVYEYGTNEQLELFTEAIERWDVSAINQLPEYMKVCYQALLDIYSEIHEKFAHNGNLYRIHHAREAMKKVVKGYFDEAKLFRQKHMPSLDEYMSVSLVTCGYLLLITTSFVGMEEASLQ